MVWTRVENGGELVGEENTRIRCKSCKVERRATSWMDGL